MKRGQIVAGKILIVDDEERIRGLIRKTLEFVSSEFEIYEAKDGIEAVNMAGKIKPDVMIVDVMMPGMNGYDVCRKIKSSSDTKNAYVIFLTARGGSISKSTMELCGGNEIVTKPFDTEELGNKVKKALGMA